MKRVASILINKTFRESFLKESFFDESWYEGLNSRPGIEKQIPYFQRKFETQNGVMSYR